MSKRIYGAVAGLAAASLLVTAAVGRARAARMALLAEKISAPEALSWGLITSTVADDDAVAGAGGGVPPAAQQKKNLRFYLNTLSNKQQELCREYVECELYRAQPQTKLSCVHSDR